MIGELINKFDNSDGTIKAFNKIFNTSDLEGSGDVEILGIVGAGRIYTRYLEVNGERTEYNFDPLAHPTVYRERFDKEKKNFGGGDAYDYYAEKGEEVKVFKTGTALGRFLGVSQSIVSKHFNLQKKERYEGYKLTRVNNENKKNRYGYTYYAEKDGVTQKFDTCEKVASLLGLTQGGASKLFLKEVNDRFNGYKLTRKARTRNGNN
jgi:hypothetical protein